MKRMYGDAEPHTAAGGLKIKKEKNSPSCMRVGEKM